MRRPQRCRAPPPLHLHTYDSQRVGPPTNRHITGTRPPGMEANHWRQRPTQDQPAPRYIPPLPPPPPPKGREGQRTRGKKEAFSLRRRRISCVAGESRPRRGVTTGSARRPPVEAEDVCPLLCPPFKLFWLAHVALPRSGAGRKSSCSHRSTAACRSRHGKAGGRAKARYSCTKGHMAGGRCWWSSLARVVSSSVSSPPA